MDKQKQKTNQNEAEISPAGEEKKTRLIVLLAALGIVIILAASFLFWQKEQEKQARMEALEQQLQKIQKETLKNQSSPVSEIPEQAAPAGQAPEDEAAAPDDYPEEYKGWQTYTNYEAGYKLRYPSTWAIREISGISQIFNEPVNYIVIDSPQKRFSLQWAMRNAGDNFLVSERTGIGVGENVPDGHITILGNEVDINLYSYKGKADEILYPSMGTAKIDGGKREILADFSGGPDNATDDLKNMPERYIAEKILRSVRLIDQKKAGCPSTLTSPDLEAMANWAIFTNPKYNFSFRYPENWEISASNNTDYVTFDDNTFQFRSGPMTATDFMGYKEESKTNSKIACENASREYFCGDPSADPPLAANQCMLMAQFEKNGAPHLITYSFKSLGASLSDVYGDTFDLILKSIKFY